MNSRNNKKFKDPIVYYDALAMVVHRIESEHESGQHPACQYHQHQYQRLRNKYRKTLPEQYQYLDGLLNKLECQIKAGNNELSAMQQDLHIQICKDLFSDLMIDIMKSNSELNYNEIELLVVNHFLCIQLCLNLMCAEKRFMLEKIVKDSNEQSSLHPTAQQDREILYRNRYAEEYGESYNDMFEHHHSEVGNNFYNLFKDKIDSLNGISSSFTYDSSDVEDFENDVRQYFAKWLASLRCYKDELLGRDIDQNLSSDDERTIKTKMPPAKRAMHNHIGEFLHYLDNASEQRLPKIKRPLDLMSKAKDELLGDTAKAGHELDSDGFLSKLIAVAKDSVKKLAPKFDLLTAFKHKDLNKDNSSKGSVQKSGMSDSTKYLLYLFGGALLGSIALSLVVCTGGLSALAFTAFHLIYVAPLVQGLVIAGGGLLGASLGFGAKKAVDMASIELMTVKHKVKNKLPQVNASEAEARRSQSPVYSEQGKIAEKQPHHAVLTSHMSCLPKNKL